MNDEYLRFLFERINEVSTNIRTKAWHKNLNPELVKLYLDGKLSGYRHARLFYNNLLKRKNPDAKELPCICCGKIMQNYQAFWEDEDTPLCSEGCIDLYYDEDNNLKEDARNKLLEERNNPVWYDA